MRVYVDFDDVVCETARCLSAWARERFGIGVPYEDIRWFDLRRSLRLNDGQYEELMARAHADDSLLRYPPTPGAVKTLSRWRRAGLEVTVVTGRPVATRAVSYAWLAHYGLAGLPIIFVDKYRREPAVSPGAPRALTLDEFDALTFDIAVEDAPLALDLLAANPGTRAFVFDRPWNRDYTPASGRVERAADWAALATAVAV